MRFVARWLGGVYDLGPISICLHDGGVIVARRKIEMHHGREWAFRTVWREWKWR